MKADAPPSDPMVQETEAASCPVGEREALWTLSYTSVLCMTDQKAANAVEDLTTDNRNPNAAAAEAEVNDIVRAARPKNQVHLIDLRFPLLPFALIFLSTRDSLLLVLSSHCSHQTLVRRTLPREHETTIGSGPGVGE